MRRILRKIAANEHDQLGDTSTLADPSVVDSLVRERMNRPADEMAAAAGGRAEEPERSGRRSRAEAADLTGKPTQNRRPAPARRGR